MTVSYAQYGPGTDLLPANAAKGVLRRNATNDGWEEIQPENLLVDAAASVNVNNQEITNVNLIPSTAQSAAPRQYVDDHGTSGKNVSAYIMALSGATMGTTQPLDIPDASFAVYPAGGSVAGAGVLGQVATVFASLAAETGVAAGQGGLGSAAALNQPLNFTDFPGSSGVSVRLNLPGGLPATLADFLTVPPVGDEDSVVYGYTSYRTDLTANHKGRMWFYYRSVTTGFETPFTPNISVHCDVYVPIVTTLAAQPVNAGLGAVSAAGVVSGVVPATLSDITAISDATTLAGATGRQADGGHVHPHGNRGGGSLHAGAIAAGAAGFMTGADKTKLDGLPSSAPPTTLTIGAGAGLTGGGDLSTDRTINVVANADGSIVVNADDIQVGVISDVQHGTRNGGTLHAAAIAGGAAGFMSGADKSKLDHLSDDSFNATQQTLNATPVVVPLYTPADNKEVTIRCTVAVRNSAGTSGASFHIFGGFRRSGSTTTQIGTTRIMASAVDTGFGVVIDLGTTGTTINAVVTGILATVIDWHMTGIVTSAP